MAHHYAKDQPPGFTNSIERVAIVGAGGQFGSFITAELLKTGRHTITALTREGSTTSLPPNIHSISVNYDNEQTLIEALHGQQYLIITLSVFAPPDTQLKLINAAAKAGVAYVMPNFYGYDIANEKLCSESPLGGTKDSVLPAIEKAGVAWTALVCNLWYEYSLVMGPIWFGFDFAAKKLTLYGDGDTKVNVTTWEQCARAVAAFVSLKVLPDDENDASPTISGWRNKPLYVSSFLVSQKDMFESWKRVSGDKDEEWTVESQPYQERYMQGMEQMRNATDPRAARMGAALASFVRCFFPNGGGDYETSPGLDNEKLGLPKEDLDERTKVAKAMLEDDFAKKRFARMTS